MGEPFSIGAPDRLNTVIVFFTNIREKYLDFCIGV